MAKPKAANNKITINSDGTWDPPGGVEINPGGIVQFDVKYPTGKNTCTIPFGKISFGLTARAPRTGSNTIKVGSGSGGNRRK